MGKRLRRFNNYNLLYCLGIVSLALLIIESVLCFRSVAASPVLVPVGNRQVVLSVSKVNPGKTDVVKNGVNGTLIINGDDEVAGVVNAAKSNFEKNTGISVDVRNTNGCKGLLDLENGNADIAMYDGPMPTSQEPLNTDANRLEDNGRSYSSDLVFQSPSNIGAETAVVGASSFFLPVQSRGGVRIRVWSRLEDVRKYYKTGIFGTMVFIGVGGAKFELNCVDPRNMLNHEAFVINATNPDASPDTSSILDTFTYDILSFIEIGPVHIPTNLIAAVVNNFNVDKILRDKAKSYDNTLEFKQNIYGEIPENIVNLPPSIPYYSADLQTQNSNYDPSGAEAAFFFDWNLPGDQRAINAVASAKIRYDVLYQGSITPFYIWSGDAQENITINP
jgi:hypothetical protein